MNLEQCYKEVDFEGIISNAFQNFQSKIDENKDFQLSDDESFELFLDCLALWKTKE